MEKEQPIFITGVERSGSSFVSRILGMSGGFLGETNIMFENKQIREALHFLMGIHNHHTCNMVDFRNIDLYDVDWYSAIMDICKQEGWDGEQPIVYKDSGLSETWPLWHKAFPEAKWIIVRRRNADIVNSCKQTAYMKKFKSSENRRQIGVFSEEEGWLWWIHEYEKRFLEIVEATKNHMIVWPERMADGNYEQMKEVVQWVGLQWNPEVENIITPLFKNRR